MDEYDPHAIANRNEPIPVISPPKGDPKRHEQLQQHQQQHQRSGSASGRSIQDRLFTKYVCKHGLAWMHVANRRNVQVLAADVSRGGEEEGGGWGCGAGWGEGRGGGPQTTWLQLTVDDAEFPAV